MKTVFFCLLLFGAIANSSAKKVEVSWKADQEILASFDKEIGQFLDDGMVIVSCAKDAVYTVTGRAYIVSIARACQVKVSGKIQSKLICLNTGVGYVKITDSADSSYTDSDLERILPSCVGA